MLPDAAAVTRDEQPSRIVGLRVGLCEGFAERRARVVLLAANAPRDLLFVHNVFVSLGGLFGSFGLFGLVGALAASWRLAGVFAGEGVWRCGFLVVVETYAAAILTIG